MGTTSGKSVATRLVIHPGHSVHLVNAPRDQTALLRQQLPPGARLATARDLPADRVVFYAENQGTLNARLRDAEAATAADGALWVAYPKLTAGRSDLSRQIVHDALRLSGWKPVAQISVDDVWSAIRARPATAAERRRT